MTERVHAHKARWRSTPEGRRLVCLCGWPGDTTTTLAPGAETAKAFLVHLRETRTTTPEVSRV